MKEYIVPKINVVGVIPTNVIASSSAKGCSCGCYSRDYPQTNCGCYGCPKCNHDNSSNHACDNEGFWKK